MNREIKIIEDIQKLLSKDKITPSDVDELFDQLDNLLFSDEGDSKKFGVLLNMKIVDKLFNEVVRLKNQISKLGNSRSNWEKKQILKAKENILNNLMIKLFASYSDYLNNNEAYKIYGDNHYPRIEKICQNLLHENVNEEYPFPEYYDKNNADRLISEIEEYYKNAFLNPENTLFVQTKITNLSESLKSKKADIDNQISIWKKRGDEYKKELLSFSNEQSEEKDRIFNLYDCEMTGVMNLYYYQNDIIRLYNHIAHEYPFVNSKPITTSAISVFGDSNIEAIKRVYSEFSNFIDIVVTSESDFVQAFFDLPITNKINLINGTLTDYAYFIKKMKPFFISKYRDDSGAYNQWWSDRFLFSGKKKNKHDISTWISALRKEREAKKAKAQIDNIILFLSSSYISHK